MVHGELSLPEASNADAVSAGQRPDGQGAASRTGAEPLVLAAP